MHAGEPLWRDRARIRGSMKSQRERSHAVRVHPSHKGKPCLFTASPQPHRFGRLLRHISGSARVAHSEP